MVTKSKTSRNIKSYRYPSSVYSNFLFKAQKISPKKTTKLCFPGESTYLWLKIGLLTIQKTFSRLLDEFTF